MEIFRNLTVVLAITTLVACNDVTIEGSWVESVPGISNLKQGFTLEANGSASSINMATLKYEKWKKEGNLLIDFIYKKEKDFVYILVTPHCYL